MTSCAWMESNQPALPCRGSARPPSYTREKLRARCAPGVAGSRLPSVARLVFSDNPVASARGNASKKADEWRVWSRRIRTCRRSRAATRGNPDAPARERNPVNELCSWALVSLVDDNPTAPAHRKREQRPTNELCRSESEARTPRSHLFRDNRSAPARRNCTKADKCCAWVFSR